MGRSKAMPRTVRNWLGLAGSWATIACSGVAAQGIFTCIDATGRRVSSDRPIAACADREQKELNASGTVRRTLAPTLTAVELAMLDENDKLAAEDRARVAEARRRDRTLLARYPSQEAHDRARALAMNLAGGQDAKARLVAHFDKELARLQELWQHGGAPKR